MPKCKQIPVIAQERVTLIFAEVGNHSSLILCDPEFGSSVSSRHSERNA